MNQVKLNNISDEIIDFDDEYSENENFPEDPTPDMSARQKAQMNQKDQIQATPEEEDPDQNDQNGNNIIYDPKVKELNEIDINNKKAIIDFLMNDEIIFKSALCDNLNIKKTDKIPESLLKPEFEISFYNDDFEEKKIKINYNDLFQGVEIKEFPDFQINILPQFVKKNRLIKLIKNGLNLDLSIAIDFTGSNGCPEYPTCLHYINHGFINNYEKAIRENYKIISTLNEKDKYDIYGFGAEINGIFEKGK